MDEEFNIRAGNYNVTGYSVAVTLENPNAMGSREVGNRATETVHSSPSGELADVMECRVRFQKAAVVRHCVLMDLLKVPCICCWPHSQEAEVWILLVPWCSFLLCPLLKALRLLVLFCLWSWN